MHGEKASNYRSGIAERNPSQEGSFFGTGRGENGRRLGPADSGTLEQ